MSFLILITIFSKSLIKFDGSSEINGLKISGVVDLKAIDESWKSKQENQRRPVEAGQESSDG